MATIKCVSYLKNVAGFHEKSITLTEPTKLNEIVSFPEFDEDRIVVLINEKGGKMNSLIENGDYVKILPVTGGG